MEKIGSICILNRGGLPLKKGPLRIYGLIDVSGSIPLFRSYLAPIKNADGPLFNFFSWEPGYKRHPSHGKDWVHLHFKSGRSTPKKRTPSYIWAYRTYLEVSHYLGQYSPDLKMQMDRCLFFSWEPGYIRLPSHGKDWVHLHFKSGRSTPKKRTPSYIWAYRRIWKYPII